jgi:hypothetical protein
MDTGLQPPKTNEIIVSEALKIGDAKKSWLISIQCHPINTAYAE